MQELLKQIGQLFVIGYPGEEPPESFLDFVAEDHIGGVILFEENCRTDLAARENIRRIKARCQTPPLIAIDQEGGRVSRLKGAPAEYRAASVYGARKDIEHFREDYTRAVVLLESIGVNVNLAPVVDLWLNDKNDCLAQRCFSSDPEVVAMFARASVAVAHSHGLLSCLKHFPGLGAARIDPHRKTATADYDLLVWQQRERIPFAAGIEAGTDMIMTTHLSLPRIDPVPATGSRKVVGKMIRENLEFDGVVITDDLTMKGADSLGDIGERTVAAFNAGHDLLLFGSDFESAVQAYDRFARAVSDREIDKAAIRASLDRIAGLKFRLGRSVVR